MIYIIDSYAWVEYFIGSKAGGEVKKLMDDVKNKFITIECCLAEIKGWCLKEKKNFEEVFKVIRSNSEIKPVLTEDWLDAGTIKFEIRKKIKDFGLIDSILLSKQQKYLCKILTGDEHFKNLKNIEYVGD